MTVMDKFLKWYNYPQLNEELKKDLETLKIIQKKLQKDFIRI